MYIKTILTLIVFSLSVYANETMTLTTSDEIADAIKINRAIDHVTDKVMECVNNNLAPAKECYCLYPREVTSFKSTVQKILKKHPNWEGKTISWQIKNDPKGYGYTISILGIQTQMKMMCE